MPPDAAHFTKSLSQVRSRRVTADLDCLLFWDMKNIRYLTGFTGSDGALLLERERTVLLVDGRYTTQARAEAGQTEIIEYRDKVPGISEILVAGKIKAAGFEAAAVSFETYRKLKETVSDINLIPLPGDIDLRAIKDEAEIALIRQAAGIASQTLAAMQGDIKPGVKERDVALELEYRIRQNGAEGVAFPPIVASGSNAALPHAHPGERRLSPGDAVVIDFGAIYEGYHSDETCTFFLGFASARQRELYAIVKEAHDRALASVMAGMACREVDRIARMCIEEKGFRKFFSHGTGHGVGLDIHEPPRIAPPSQAILKAGMVVTIEPGIYIPGEWGIRIEDTILVKRDGYEVLTKILKDFTVLY